MDLLIAFLNELFRGRKVIANLYYNKNEHVGDTEDIGTVIFTHIFAGKKKEGAGTQKKLNIIANKYLTKTNYKSCPSNIRLSFVVMRKYFRFKSNLFFDDQKNHAVSIKKIEDNSTRNLKLVEQ